MSKSFQFVAIALAATLVAVSCSRVDTKPQVAGCAAIERAQFESFFFGQKIRPQPVYSGGGLYGWRVYEEANSKVLPELGLRARDLVTHFCGVEVSSILDGNGENCCSIPPKDTVVLTIERDGQTVQIAVPMPPNNAFKADVAKATRP